MPSLPTSIMAFRFLSSSLVATTLLLFITVERLKRLLNPQLQSDRSTLYQPGGYFCGVWAKVAYPTGCANKPRSYYDYDNNSCIPPRHLLRNRDEFQLLRRLGAGKFSDVFEAVIVNDKEMEVAQKQQQDFRPTHSTHPYADINDELGGVHDDDNDDAIDERSLVVIKCLKPVSERKIRRELLALTHASQLPNLARLLGVCWNQGEKVDEMGDQERKTDATISSRHMDTSIMPALIMKHAGVDAQWLCHESAATNREGNSKKTEEGHDYNNGVFLTTNEIKYYLYELLIALDGLHSIGIMHRDVKPRNVLITRSIGAVLEKGFKSINRSHKQGSRNSLMLIDLGLADFYIPGQRYSVRVASRHYKAPELLIGLELYDFSLDLWGVGCILAGLLFRREPFFRGKDNVDQLVKIASVLGTSGLYKYCNKFNVKLSSALRSTLGSHQKRPWLSFVGSGAAEPGRNALRLLEGLLKYDHTRRLTAAEAMNHPFFDEVRDAVHATHSRSGNAFANDQ